VAAGIACVRNRNTQDGWAAIATLRHKHAAATGRLARNKKRNTCPVKRVRGCIPFGSKKVC